MPHQYIYNVHIHTQNLIKMHFEKLATFLLVQHKLLFPTKEWKKKNPLKLFIQNYSVKPKSRYNIHIICMNLTAFCISSVNQRLGGRAHTIQRWIVCYCDAMIFTYICVSLSRPWIFTMSMCITCINEFITMHHS